MYWYIIVPFAIVIIQIFCTKYDWNLFIFAKKKSKKST